MKKLKLFMRKLISMIFLISFIGLMLVPTSQQFSIRDKYSLSIIDPNHGEKVPLNSVVTIRWMIEPEPVSGKFRAYDVDLPIDEFVELPYYERNISWIMPSIEDIKVIYVYYFEENDVAGAYDFDWFWASPVVTTTTTTLPTTTTISTTTTTLPTTTTSTVVTNTTLSLPTSLTCEHDQITVDQISSCNIVGCNNGVWTITNFIGTPLDEFIVMDIPPTRVNFGPFRSEGKILVKMVCFEPSSVVLKKYVDVVPSEVESPTTTLPQETTTTTTTVKVSSILRKVGLIFLPLVLLVIVAVFYYTSKRNFYFL